MEESNEPLKVVPELYFLIAKFLSGGPLKETAKTLLKELENIEVLPRRLDWEGNEHAQSYNDIASQYRDVPWDRLASVCERALHLARSASTLSLPPQVADQPSSASASTSSVMSFPSTSAPALPGAAGSSAGQDYGERLTAKLSLLSESLVRSKPKYSLFKQDHSLVRRIVSRELGVGRAALAGGAGGRAMFPARLLSGLQLQRRTLGHLSAVYCLVFDCTGRYVVTGADDLLVKVWSASDGRLLATLRGAGAEITDVCASADGALLACGSVERLVRVWCLVTGQPKAVLHAHAGTITAVHWAPPAHDVRWLASTSTDGSVAFWTCADGQFLSQPVQYVERLRPGACHMICAAWSAGGAFLAAGSADHHVRLYAVRKEPGGPRRVLETAVHGDAVDSIAWAHRGLRFVSGSKDGTAAVWTLHATQWRHTLLLPQAHARDNKRLKVTMVCWDCSDAYVITAVSDNTIRVWCSRTCAQVSCLKGHRDEAYVLEAHPFLPAVLLSAGHDGQLFVWDAAHAQVLAKFHNHIDGQGDGAIFDAKWGGGATVAASDSHGHLLLLGLGKGHRLLRQLPTELFFHTDYRPLVRDALGGALDEQTETPPHLMPPPFLVDVEGAPHPPQLQRLVPGRELLTLSQLIPAITAHRALDRMIQELAGEREEGALAAPSGGVWRGEGVRHTAGSWQRGDPLLVPHSTRPIVPDLPPAHVRAIEAACEEMNALEQAWYRREMRRRPLMISTAPHAPAKGPRRRAGRPRAPPGASARAPRQEPMQPEEPPEPESVSSDTSDSSVRLSRDSPSSRTSRSRASSATCSDSSSSSSTSSQYSDWEAGAALAPPARARRRPLKPARRYSPSSVPPKRPERADAPTPTTSSAAADNSSPTPPAPAVELPEAYRVGEWLTAVSPRKAPYHPQMGDECLYFRLGHQRYFEAVAEKDLYKINPRDKPWERTHVYECEVVKVIGIKYVIKPPRVVCLRLSAALDAPRPRTFTVRYHDMPDVIDFLVLRQQYEAATNRRWGQGDRFRCMIDDSWWTGVVLERTGAEAEAEAGAGVEAGAGGVGGGGAAASFSAAAAPHFLSLRVRWDNGEVERLSPWDLEPIDMDRLPAEPGGAVPVLPHELEAALYRAEQAEWPPRGDRPAACRAIAQHVGQVMSLSVAEPFVAPVDLQQYPAYARVVPYPIDLATIRARFDNLFYRRAAAAQFDVRYLASNAEQFNEPHSPIVRQARLVTDLLLYIISHWRDVDVLSKYRELAASYHSSDDEPLANTVANKGKRSQREGRSRAARAWAASGAAVLHELMCSPDAEPFKQPVSPEAAPDYSRVISHPMDLGTVGSKLAAGQYSSREQFAHDVRRVFANSRLYNTNKRSRIYSMTVRLSALFESLWSRAASSPARAATRDARSSRRTRRRHTRRRTRTESMNGYEEVPPPAGARSSSSSSEPLAATSRRVHGAGAGAGAGLGAGAGAGPRPQRAARVRLVRRDSWDSDVPLHDHRKGKGVGKKSKSSTNSTEPVASTSADTNHHAPYTETNGLPSGSEGSALLEGSSVRSERDHSSPYSSIQVVEEELPEDELDLTYGETHERTDQERARSSRRARKRLLSSDSSYTHTRLRTKRTLHRGDRPKRARERFTSGSSSSSTPDSTAEAAAEDAGRYESDRSYRPRYSTDDDAPLHLYRQRQEGVDSGSAGPSRRRAVNGHSRGGAPLRARLSPGRYNEDSESDSVFAISKRMQLQPATQHHRTQRLVRNNTAALAHSDHNYFVEHAPHARLEPATPDAPPGDRPHRHDAAVPVSISSRGRVRKLTPKGQGLYGRKHHQ